MYETAGKARIEESGDIWQEKDVATPKQLVAVEVKRKQ